MQRQEGFMRDECDANNRLHVRSSMTGKEFTIQRSEVSRLVGNYITQSDIDPSLNDTPILSRTKQIKELDDDLIRPSFIQKPKIQSVLSEAHARFDCLFVASPRPSVVWLHSDAEIKANSAKYKTTLERDMFSYQAFLEIQSCQSNDAGTYKVVVRNREGEATASVPLVVTERSNVELPHTDTTSSHRKSEMKLNLDSMTHLDSGNEGLLPRTNGATPRQPYSPRKYYERRARGGRTSSLSEPSRTSSSTPCGRTHSLSRSSEMEQSMSSISTLSSLSGGSPPQDKLSMLQSDQEASDQGDIESPITHSSRQSCIKTQISNEGVSVALFRRDDTDTSGIETLHSSRTSVKRDHSVSPLKNSNRGVPPVVISELPENVSVNTGDAISLTCSVSGRPRPKVLWMRDAEDVRNAAHYSFEEALRSTEDKLTYDFMLSLVDAQREHSGTYTLSAFNLYGDVTSHTLLSVVDHMSKEEPNCNASNNDEYLERGCETLEDQSESDQNCVIDSDILVTEDETNAQLYSNNELEFEMGNGIRKILRSSECTKIDAEETLNLSITELTNETLEFRDDNKPETELFILSDDEKLECDKIAQNLQETGDVYIQTRIETNSPVNCSARCEESGLDGNTTFQHEPKGEICKASRFTVTKVENHIPNNLEDSVPTSTNNKETEYLSDSSEIEPPQELVTPIEDTNIIITEEQTEKPTKSIGYLGRIPTIEVEPVEDESNISEDLAESSDNETISDQSPLPYFTQELKNVTVLEGSNVELQCTTAFDDLKITWYKNAEQIINGRDGYFVESKDGHHRLTILDARWSEDEGIFTCQAETSTDVICTTSEVYVEMTKEKLYKILDFQQPTSTVTDENTSLDSTPELPQEQTNENLDDSIYHSAEESLDHFENSEDFMERHELSPILEEEEECISRASSSVRLSTEQISTSAQNPSIIFRRSSYDSLASFEAHEKLVASLPADALRIESDKPNETNTCPSDDSDEEYLEGACPSRASSACRPLAFTPDDMATRCRDFSDNEGGSRPGSVNSRRSLWRKGSKSDSFDLARCLEMDEESDATMTDNNYMSCDDDELLFTLDCHSDDNMPPVPENSSPVDDTLPAEIDNFPSTNNEEPVCETPACSYQDTVEHIVETTPVRTLSMDVLQPYTATIVKNEPLVEEESNERDELADEFLGYRYERSRADSVFDLKSLHERVKGLDVTESRRSSEGFESNESSEPCEDLCVDVNGNLKIVPAIEVREAPDSGEELIIPSPESLRSFPRRDIKSPVGKRGLTLDDVIRISAPAFDAVSSIADDFYSCVSSTATTPTCGFRTDECPSETGYQTPPEKANRPTELKYFETGSEDKETEYEDCSTPVNSPGHSEQTTATASGFETPPKFYYVIPPKFLGKKSIQITVMRGGCAIIACSVISHPEAKVAWYKDGRLMDIYNRVSQHIYNEPPKEWSDNFGNQGNWRPDWLCQLEDRDIGCPQQLDVHYVLKIQHLVPRDGGLYICKAWNSAGVATRIIRLSVE
uniref:Uncharacterized protein LOC100184276 n=1 Tax=Phallusia mammillata TaxID=59560 RepID=A0A6F9DI34_9ASCI|nr:uncharacterized protein LOC100184276 [Phallusia mammillata]